MDKEKMKIIDITDEKYEEMLKFDCGFDIKNLSEEKSEQSTEKN